MHGNPSDPGMFDSTEELGASQDTAPVSVQLIVKDRPAFQKAVEEAAREWSASSSARVLEQIRVIVDGVEQRHGAYETALMEVRLKEAHDSVGIKLRLYDPHDAGMKSIVIPHRQQELMFRLRIGRHDRIVASPPIPRGLVGWLLKLLNPM